MVSKIIDMKKSAIICVASPLQALCAIEAIKHFKIENYRLYVVNDNISLSNIVEVLGEKIHTKYCLSKRSGFFNYIL